MEKVNLAEKLSSFTDYWNPRIVAELNGQPVRAGQHPQHRDLVDARTVEHPQRI